MPIQQLFTAEQAQAAMEARRTAIAEAFGRGWGVQVEVGSITVLAGGTAGLPALRGAGLVFAFQLGESLALGLIPESAGIIPAGCIEPDAAAESRLQALAQELGNLLFPEPIAAAECLIARVRDVAEVVERAELAADCASVGLRLTTGGQEGELMLVWPAARAEGLVPLGQGGPHSAVPDQELSPRRGTKAVQYRDFEDGLRLLPAYARSLLKISVPVTVTLAEARQPLRAILDIGPGSIIHFNKSCEDTLTLEVSGHKFAVGETVKVGDKFGLWITAIVLPDERFWVISNKRQAIRAK